MGKIERVGFPSQPSPGRPSAADGPLERGKCWAARGRGVGTRRVILGVVTPAVAGGQEADQRYVYTYTT